MRPADGHRLRNGVALLLVCAVSLSAIPANGLIGRGLAAPSLSGPYPIFNFMNADSPVVDPRTGYLYVADIGYGRTTIYDPAQAAVVGFIDGIAGTMTLDPVTNQLVVLQGTGAVFVNVTTHEVIATTPNLAPDGWRRPVIALDPDDDLVFAAYNFQDSGTIWLGSTIQVLSPRLHAAVGQIGGLWFTQGMTYDPQTRVVYAANVLGHLAVIDARTLSLVGAASGLDGPNQVAFNPVNGLLYIACYNGYYENGGIRWTASVSTVDPSNLGISQLPGFPPGSDPQYVVADPRDGSLFVANASTIAVVSAQGDPLWQVSGLDYPGPLVFDPVNGHVYAAAGAGIVDLDPARRASTFLGNGFSYPYGMAYDSARDVVYVANAGADHLTLIDPSMDRIKGSLGGFAQPTSATYDARTDELFVGNQGNYTLSVVDLKTNRMVATIPNVLPWDVLLDNGTGNLYVGTNSSLLVLSDQSLQVKANLSTYGSLVPLALDSARGRVIVFTRSSASYPVPTSFLSLRTSDLSVEWSASNANLWTAGIAVDPNNGRLYLGSVYGVMVLDGASGQQVANVSLQPFTQSVIFDPANGYVYVAGVYGEGVLTVLDPATNAIVHSDDLRDWPNRMLYVPSGQQVYVTQGMAFGPSQSLVVAFPSLNYPPPAPGWLSWAEAAAALFVVVGAIAYLGHRRRRRKPVAQEPKHDGG